MRKFMNLGLAIAVSLSSLFGSVSAYAQDPLTEAQAILDDLTAAERIGQLILVTLQGSTIVEDHPIIDLIENHHVSGVVLSAENDNFSEEQDTLDEIQALTSWLQEVEYASSLNATMEDPDTEEVLAPYFIPLLVGLQQAGGGSPYNEIYTGLSSLPSAMAIGATWDPELARTAGEVLGAELRALGINLLLGPSLDVLEDPQVVGSGDMGVRVFGGDAFWVSEIGSAFIEGIGDGAEGNLAIIAQHFPGLGGSDRDTSIEVPTIRRSQAQLEQTELTPFAAVMGTSPGLHGVVDGVLASHIRYQGFQGNISSATRPISLDSQALSTLLSLDDFASWREAGGVVVSDSLGARSIRRLYDPSEEEFRGHLVARDALIAGNDLLMLADFESENDPSGIQNIKATLAFFEQKYRDDPVFAERVDEAALRIIALKLRLYGGAFDLSTVIPNYEDISLIGNSDDVTFDIALNAATLISPSQDSLLDDLGGPPSAGERIVFFTDVREVRQCSSCSLFDELGKFDLEDEILSLYGPTGAGQITNRELTSFSTSDLAAYLGEPPPDSFTGSPASQYAVEISLVTADWIVFSVLKSSEEIYGSNALKLLLDQRPDLLQNKRIIVFAYDVPYDVDATDISKIDAYYGLYSRSASFVEIAARILFQELTPIGSSPVSIAATRYDLSEALMPDPNQVIPLELVFGDDETIAEATPAGYRQGDLIQLEAGRLLDWNGNPVRDGTSLVFTIVYQSEEVDPLQIETTTLNGFARMSLSLDRLGMLTITASSNLAQTSEILQMDVQQDVPSFVTVIAPSPVDQGSGGLDPGSGEGDPQGGDGDNTHARYQMGIGSLILGLVGMLIVSGLGFVLTRRLGTTQEQTPVRYALIGAVFALAGYDYLAMGLPGSGAILESSGVWASIVMPLAAGIAGQTVWAIATVIWRRARAN